jgi:hypothetical protein
MKVTAPSASAGRSLHEICESACEANGDTPYSGNSVTSVPVTPYTTSVDVNSSPAPSMVRGAEMTRAGRRSDGEIRPRRTMPLAGPVPAQYGEGWLKITARLVILPSRMPK